MRVAGEPMDVALGLVVVVVGLVVALTTGGWGWLMPVVGAALVGVSALSLYLDPPGGPRRRVRDLLRPARRSRPGARERRPGRDVDR